MEMRLGSWAERPEHALLLACARSRPETVAVEHIRHLATGMLDWQEVLAAAAWHRVEPLLYHSLTTACPESVPEPALASLRQRSAAIASRNQALSSELIGVLALLAEHRIRAVPYRGPVLAALVYGGTGLREFNDLDLLLHPQDVPRVRELLASRGYRLAETVAGRREAALLQGGVPYAMSRNGGAIKVDLHWAVLPREFCVSFELRRLWSELQPVPFAGAQVDGFPPETLLLILCVRGFQHWWLRLQWVCDVAEALRAYPQMDWNQVVARSTAMGTRRLLGLGLLLPCALLRARIPEEVASQVWSDPAVEMLATRICGWISRRETGPLGTPAGNVFYFALRERLRDRVRMALCPSLTDRELLPLPDSLAFLHYAVRPARLAGQWIRNLWRA